MRVVFEKQSSAAEAYPVEKQTTVTHNDGHSYTAVGESSAVLTGKERFFLVVYLVGNAFKAIFTGNWELVKQQYGEIKTGREKVIHHIRTILTPEGQQKAISTMANRMKKCIDAAEIARTSAVTFYMNIKFDNREMRHQVFLLKNNQASLTKEIFEAKVSQIEKKITDSIQPEWGAHKRNDWMILRQENPLSLYNVHGDYSINHKNGYEYSGEGDCSGEDAVNWSTTWLQTHGFSTHIFNSDGTFVQGHFYGDFAPSNG